MCNVPGASLSHLGLASNLVAFPSYSKTSDHFQVCTVFNINRDTGVESLPENLSVRIKQCDGGRRRGNGGAGGGGGGSKEQFFLCWIVLFDPERSERRALCNIFSAHMADCVTAKDTGGVVVAAEGCCGGGAMTV